MMDINSNQVYNKPYDDSCIDLISNGSSDIPITIDGETYTGTISQNYSDISSQDLESSDLNSTHQQCIIVESSEEGEIQGENETIELKEEITKTKKYKRKHPSADDETKTRKVQRIVISINTNFEQDTPYSKSSVRYTSTHTTEDTVMITKKKKKNREKKNKSRISSLNDVAIEKIKAKHCKGCKRLKKSNKSHNINKPSESNKNLTIGTVSNSAHHLRESVVVTPYVSTDYAVRDETPFKNINMDRPLPQCRRDCRRSRNDYVPKYVKYYEKNKPDLERISSDELSLSESKLDSSFSLSDIESLIVRSRKREKNPKNSSVNQIESLTVQNSDDTEQNYTEKSCDDKSKTERSKMNDFGVVNEDTQKQTTLGKIRLVPLEKLLEPTIVVDKNVNEAPLETAQKNCVDAVTNDKSKDKPIGTVIPFRHDKNKTTNAANKSNTNPYLSPISKVNPKEIEINVGSILKDQYETCEIIKKGSFSHLVKAIDKQKNIKIVLKILHMGKYSHTLDNLKLLNGLDPLDKFHCVRLVDQFFVKGHLALWLEDYSCNLRQRLEHMGSGTGFPFTVLQCLGRQLLIAVQFMRECFVLHANIRPEHILLNSNDTNLKLTGFDGAIAQNASVETSYDWQPLCYQAPEMMLKLKTSYSVDVWSAACIIYEMATSNKLFSGNENAILMQIMNLNLKFPEHMSVGEHFVNNIFYRKYSDPETGKEESAPAIPCTTKRHLQKELLPAYRQSCKAEGVEQGNEEQIRLMKALSMVLHSMLLVDPNTRITVDFALLNEFFLVTP